MKSNWLSGTLATGVCVVGLSLLLGMTASVSAQNTPPQANNPLVLKKQGTFYVGGTIEFRSPNSSTTVTGDPRSLPGNIAVHHMYVEYQVPNVLKYKYPIVFYARWWAHGSVLSDNARRTRRMVYQLHETRLRGLLGRWIKSRAGRLGSDP